jgi:hypothetical protein
MTPGGDERGQSTVVGATLLFAIAIIGLGITQAFVVPQQNAAVAQNHWEDADQDMTELRSVIDRAVDRRSSASVAIRLGQRLPDRPFLVEGTPPSGTLETRPVAITIRGQNYTAPVDENGDETINSTELNGSSPTRELRYTQSGGDWHTLTSFVGPVSTFVKQDGRVSQAVVESGERIDVLILKGNLSVAGVRTEQVELEGVERTPAGRTRSERRRLRTAGPGSLELALESDQFDVGDGVGPRASALVAQRPVERPRPAQRAGGFEHDPPDGVGLAIADRTNPERPGHAGDEAVQPIGCSPSTASTTHRCRRRTLVGAAAVVYGPLTTMLAAIGSDPDPDEPRVYGLGGRGRAGRGRSPTAPLDGGIGRHCFPRRSHDCVGSIAGRTTTDSARRLCRTSSAPPDRSGTRRVSTVGGDGPGDDRARSGANG